MEVIKYGQMAIEHWGYTLRNTWMGTTKASKGTTKMGKVSFKTISIYTVCSHPVRAYKLIFTMMFCYMFENNSYCYTV